MLLLVYKLVLLLIHIILLYYIIICSIKGFRLESQPKLIHSIQSEFQDGVSFRLPNYKGRHMIPKYRIAIK